MAVLSIALFLLSVVPIVGIGNAATPGSGPITLTSPNAQGQGNFGFSAAASGNAVVVGAPYENAFQEDQAGHAYIFTPSTAVSITLTSPNVQPFGYFGESVAVSGGFVVVGAPDETANGFIEAGHAYIFNAASGALLSTLTSPNAQPYGNFGFSVAVSGNTAVVGAYGETVNGQYDAGYAYVFNAASGSLVSTLTSPNEQQDGNFGYSVAVSGGLVAVGAFGETANNQYEAGHAYIFTSVSALPTTLTSPNAQARGSFGISVAASGNTVVVGAYGETANGFADAGHAYGFTTSGVLLSILTSPNAQEYGAFGVSVAVSGNTAVVGAWIETANNQYEGGHAYEFTTLGVLLSTLTSPNAQPYGQFGSSVAASGSTAVVGAPGETANGLINAGHAYIY